MTEDSNSGTTAVREGYALEVDRLTAWMVENVADYSGPLEIEQFKGGQSNPTYKLTTPTHAYVLRRKPWGPILKGAHAIEREARVMIALGQVDYPVPRIYGLCEDEAVVGAPFYVMDMIAGRIFWDASLPEIPPSDRAAYFDAMNETMARLHTIDALAAGLGDYGRTGNYFARQIARWSRQYREDPAAGEDANMDRLIDWLSVHIPTEDETRIVHGDFRIDNLIFHPEEPRVLAVLDWELSTLGNPLADFAYHAMMYRMPPTIVAGLAGTDIATLGIPDECTYVAAYCKRTGRKNIPNYRFYLAFNFFRLAAIFHGIKGRVLRGTAASSQAKERGECFPRLAEIGWQIAATR